jgi:hypothetical protein
MGLPGDSHRQVPAESGGPGGHGHMRESLAAASVRMAVRAAARDGQTVFRSARSGQYAGWGFRDIWLASGVMPPAGPYRAMFR